MDVQPVSSTTTQQGGSATSISPDAFLKILITELQNQDHLEPQKPEEFLTQLSQLTQVQQLNNISSSMDALTKTSQQGSIAQWLSTVGKKVDVQDNALSTGDQVTMQPQSSYDKVILTLKNADTGNVQQITFSNGDPRTYTYQGAGNVTFGISTTQNGAPVSCGVEVSRIIKGIQTSGSGVQMVFGDGKTMAVTSITKITE